MLRYAIFRTVCLGIYGPDRLYTEIKRNLIVYRRIRLYTLVIYEIFFCSINPFVAYKYPSPSQPPGRKEKKLVRSVFFLLLRWSRRRCHPSFSTRSSREPRTSVWPILWWERNNGQLPRIAVGYLIKSRSSRLGRGRREKKKLSYSKYMNGYDAGRGAKHVPKLGLEML